ISTSPSEILSSSSESHQGRVVNSATARTLSLAAASSAEVEAGLANNINERLFFGCAWPAHLRLRRRPKTRWQNECSRAGYEIRIRPPPAQRRSAHAM